MRELVLELMGEYGNLAVFLLILVENLFPPIPSEVILTFGGVMTVCTDMTPGSVIFSATVGSLVGAVILYGVGRFLPDEVFRKLLCGRTGHLLHFKPEDVDLAKGWFRDRGRSAVFLCRLVPIVRSLISIPAGIAGMPALPFLIFTTAGSLLWNTVLVYAGRIAGDSWRKFQRPSARMQICFSWWPGSPSRSQFCSADAGREESRRSHIESRCGWEQAGKRRVKGERIRFIK